MCVWFSLSFLLNSRRFVCVGSSLPWDGGIVREACQQNKNQKNLASVRVSCPVCVSLNGALSIFCQFFMVSFYLSSLIAIDFVLLTAFFNNCFD